MHLQILEAKNFRSIIIFKMKNSSSILKSVVDENRKNEKHMPLRVTSVAEDIDF